MMLMPGQQMSVLSRATSAGGEIARVCCALWWCEVYRSSRDVDRAERGEGGRKRSAAGGKRGERREEMGDGRSDTGIRIN